VILALAACEIISDYDVREKLRQAAEDLTPEGDDDSGDTGDSGDGGGGDSGEGDGDGVDSCTLAFGICYEYVGYSGTEEWCSMMAENYGVATDYAPAACSGSWILACALPAEGDLEHEATAYYDANAWDEENAAEACEGAGGEPA
jgi:hypothetical protein